MISVVTGAYNFDSLILHPHASVVMLFLILTVQVTCPGRLNKFGCSPFGRYYAVYGTEPKCLLMHEDRRLPVGYYLLLFLCSSMMGQSWYHIVGECPTPSYRIC